MTYKFLLIALFYFISASQVTADPITIFGNHQKPPKNSLINGEAQGVLIDIMRHVDQQMTGISFVYQLSPWKRAYKNAIHGRGGIIGLSMNSERLKIFDYSDVIYYEELMLVVMQGNAFEYQSTTDLAGKRVGFQRGASFGDDFEHSKDSIFIAEEDDGTKQRLLRLLHGQIDVAIIGPGLAGINAAIHKSDKLIANADQFIILDQPFKRDPNYLGFAKTMGMQNVLKQFNQSIMQARSTGKLKQITEKHSNQQD